jgi:hypothetical protein
VQRHKKYIQALTSHPLTGSIKESKRDNSKDRQGIKDIKEGYALSHVYEFLKWPIIIKMSIHKETCTHKKDTKDKSMISMYESIIIQT